MAERLVTTILLIDQSEPAPAAEADCATVVGRFGGRVEASDGPHLMAVWGPSPTPAEDAERAVRAGVEAVGASVATRASVTTGDADRAVSLLDLVPSGEVWVDEPTRSRTAAAIDFADVGRHELVGELEAARLFRAEAVVALVGGEGRASQLWVPLVGYRDELAQVKSALHRTINARAGRLLLVEGPAGAGTSRLGSELEHYIDGLAGRVWWLWGRCSPYGDDSPYSALVAVLRGRIAANEHDDREALRRKLDRALAGLALTEDERQQLSDRLFALLEGGLADFSREELHAAWLSWLEHLGGDEPVTWVIDDAHRADDGLVEFVHAILHRATTPVFVLALGRPGLLTRFGSAGPEGPSESIALTGLDDGAMGDLVDALVTDLPTQTREAVVHAAAGLPLYPIELVRYLADRGLLDDRDGTRRAGSGVATAVRPLVAADAATVAGARLDLLPSDDRQLLDAGAVLGLSFGLEALAAVSGHDEEMAGAGLTRLADRDLVARVGDALLPDFGQFAFVEPTVRDVAYARIPSDQRTELHRRAAVHLEATSGPLADLRTATEQHRRAADDR